MIGYIAVVMFVFAPAVFAVTPTPTAAASASATASAQPTIKPASGSAKQVLGETKVLGSTGAEKDIAKWAVVFFGGIIVLIWALRTVRSNAED